jgi:hypothetical protein
MAGPADPSRMTNLDLPHQFYLAPTNAPWIDGWKQFACDGLTLQADPRLPVIPLHSAADTHIGFLLGWPIRGTKLLPVAPLHLPPSVDPERAESLETFIYELGGRFLVLMLSSSCRRIYPDAGATLGLVYSKAEKAVASTLTALIAHQPDHPIWDARPGTFPDNRPNQFFPAGLTLDPDVHRLLPNHFLDLERFQPVRCYPNHPLRCLEPAEIPAQLETIRTLASGCIQAAVAAAPVVYAPLTAGRDSRMVLACARACADQIQFVTFDHTHFNEPGSAVLDLEIANALTTQYGLQHRVLPVAARHEDQSDLRYLRRTGFAGGAGKALDFLCACEQQLDLTGAWLTGFEGEVGRAFYWRSEDAARSDITPAELLQRMLLPPSDPFLTAMEQWLHQLPPGLPLPTILDLAYTEHRLGCWAAPHLYGAAPFQMNLVPLCHRAIFEVMLQLPPDYKLHQALARDLIAGAWPELLQLPFNEHVGLRKLIDHLRRAPRELKWAMQRKVRNALRHRN